MEGRITAVWNLDACLADIVAAGEDKLVQLLSAQLIIRAMPNGANCHIFPI